VGDGGIFAGSTAGTGADWTGRAGFTVSVRGATASDADGVDGGNGGSGAGVAAAAAVELGVPIALVDVVGAAGASARGRRVD
jgi:hypothetical protein